MPGGGGQSSAQVWRDVAARQREYGNSVGVMEDAAGGECLLGSMGHLGVSSGEQRRAEKAFERIHGERPSPFNDYKSASAEETAQAAERVAEILEGQGSNVSLLSRARARRALPVSQQGWMSDSNWVRGYEPVEAAR